jgi:hypothetical protein
MSALDALLRRFEGVKEHNGYFMALCPAHHDRDPSLSISQADDGRVLIKCHAGCATESIVEAIGLEMSDLFDDGGGVLTPPATVQRCNTPHKNRMGMHKAPLRVEMKHRATVQHPLTEVGTRLCGSWVGRRRRTARSGHTPSMWACPKTSCALLG